jgi:hypothetical protein
VLNWLERSGYPADVATDLDLHVGIEKMHSYSAFMLTTHPEYWTTEMYQNLENYLNQGVNYYTWEEMEFSMR